MKVPNNIFFIVTPNKNGGFDYEESHEISEVVEENKVLQNALDLACKCLYLNLATVKANTWKRRFLKQAKKDLTKFKKTC